MDRFDNCDRIDSKIELEVSKMWSVLDGEMPQYLPAVVRSENANSEWTTNPTPTSG